MKKYISFIHIYFITGIQYRAAALAGVSTQFAWGFMNLLMYQAFYKVNASTFPMALQEITSYIWLQQGFLMLFMVWAMESDIFEAISNGNIAYELSRPLDLYKMWFSRTIAYRLSRTFLRCIPLFVVVLLIPEPFCLQLPNNLTTLVWFIISMILSILVITTFCMLIYITTFFTLSSMGVRIIASTTVEFLAGAIIPLPFFPEKIKWLVDVLPFASMQNTPLLIYCGKITENQMISTLALQLFWFVVLFILGKILMKKALKKVVIQGG